MTIPIDTITKRKLLLAKQLYQQAEEQSDARHSFPSRIMCIIGFDLAVETLLKVLVGVLDEHKGPSENFVGLLDQCNSLLSDHSLPALPNRAHILYVHSIRNDAQHKAKYPNEIDINDCRTYVRDFLRDVMQSIWGVSLDELSPLEWIDDAILRRLLEVSFSEIQTRDRKKGLTLAGIAFIWASQCILESLPRGADGLYEGQVPELKWKTIEYINAVLKHIENTAKHYSAMVSNGTNPVEHKRFIEATPFVEFMYSSDINKPEVQNLKIRVYWGDKEPDHHTAIWAHHFVVNSIVNWQQMGLRPNAQHKDQVEQSTKLLDWSSDDVSLL